MVGMEDEEEDWKENMEEKGESRDPEECGSKEDRSDRTATEDEDEDVVDSRSTNVEGREVSCSPSIKTHPPLVGFRKVSAACSELACGR